MKRLIAVTTVAAALLLGGTAHAGWYLMSPPISNIVGVPQQVLSDSPLSRWNTGEAFDSASQCENAVTANKNKSDAQLQAEIMQSPQLRVHPEWFNPKDLPLLKQDINETLCIESSDPRLAK